jgi:hypothetical protein
MGAVEIGSGLVAAALAQAAELGPFFALTATDGLAFTASTGAEGRERLAERLTIMGNMLGTDEQRPLASMLHLGAAAACVGPVLACAAQSGIVPLLTPEALTLSYAGGRLELGLAAEVGGRSGLLPELARAVALVALEGLLEPLTSAITTLVPLPTAVTSGNTFSALAAAARLITPYAAGRRARAIVDLIGRTYAPLDGAGVLRWQDERDGQAYFRRSNCCLFYRVPGAGYCGDCVLVPVGQNNDT